MNGSFASGTDRSQKCFHITVHLGCVCASAASENAKTHCSVTEESSPAEIF